MRREITLPQELKKHLTDFSSDHIIVGRLQDQIVEYKNATGTTYYLKCGFGISAERLTEEAKILRLLHQKDFLTPRVISFHRVGHEAYLLMSGVKGVPAHRLKDHDIHEVLEIVATSLRHFHGLNQQDVLFPDTLERDLSLIQKYLTLKVINVQQFQENNQGRTPEEVFEYLTTNRQLIENTVLTHGDFCLPNVLIKGSKYGYIDLGDCGVGDKYKDLSSMEGSIRRNFGEEWIKVFYHFYDPNLEIQRQKIEYFQLIDQFDYFLDIERYNQTLKRKNIFI